MCRCGFQNFACGLFLDGGDLFFELFSGEELRQIVLVGKDVIHL